MNIEELRNDIDKIDDEFLNLLMSRLKISGRIALQKKEDNLPVFNPARERDILYRMCSESDESMESFVKIFYNTLFDISRTYQNTLIAQDSELKGRISKALVEGKTSFPSAVTVACQGVEGAYSQIAAEKIFNAAKIMYMHTFEGVFNSVEQGLCKYGVLPIENSTAGSVTDVYEQMKKYKFYIVRSVKLRINHVLLTKKKCCLSDINEIFSHEQAINQCGEFLKNNPQIKVTVCENTAAAAEMIAKSERNDIAAISSKNCAELYGLSVSLEGFQNSDNNYTRFICISKGLEIFNGADKISLMMSADNKAGSLYTLITKFSVLDLNLTKLESRPIAGTDFEFMFYFDVDGSVEDEKVLSLICQLEKSMNSFVFLGNYREV
ncbi:MAG: chorismate mutase [Clostridiales bacterium]|jgi:chorismate mutase/prephenate dehydratase|nr:chorismate mutase [Clostridiales bacterium]